VSGDAVFFQLLRLASPALPVGAYCYSQGLEAALELRLVHDGATAREWLAGVLDGPVTRFDAALVGHAWRAVARQDGESLREINDRVLASRETQAQRAETQQMGYSLRMLLESVPEGVAWRWPPDLATQVTFPVAWAVAARCFGIAQRATVGAFLFGWLENQLVVLMKAMPMGHTAGQQLLSGLIPALEAATDVATGLVFDDLSNFAPLLGWVAMRHETQYSRLFRS